MNQTPGPTAPREHSRHLTRELLREWLLLAGFLSSLLFFAIQGNWFNRAELFTYDLIVRGNSYLDHVLTQRELPQDPLIVAIDDASLNRYGRWPWPRSMLAQVVERIAEAHPQALFMDIILAEEDSEHPEQDQQLARAIRQNGKVVLPVFFHGDDQHAELVLPAPPFSASAAGQGHIHALVDPDGITRRLYRWEALGTQAHRHVADVLLQLSKQTHPRTPAPPPPTLNQGNW